jgi:hypothetical protein
MTKGHTVGVQLSKGFLVLLRKELKVFAGELEVLPRNIGVHSLCRSRPFVAFQVYPYGCGVCEVGQVVPNLSRCCCHNNSCGSSVSGLPVTDSSCGSRRLRCRYTRAFLNASSNLLAEMLVEVELYLRTPEWVILTSLELCELARSGGVRGSYCYKVLLYTAGGAGPDVKRWWMSCGAPLIQ